MGETNVSWLPLVYVLTRDRTYNLGKCPDLGLSCQPSTLWDDAQPTEPRQSGQAEFSSLSTCLPFVTNSRNNGDTSGVCIAC